MSLANERSIPMRSAGVGSAAVDRHRRPRALSRPERSHGSRAGACRLCSPEREETLS